jgi:hypothetical protein
MIREYHTKTLLGDFSAYGMEEGMLNQHIGIWLGDGGRISRARENVRERSRISAQVDPRKQAISHWFEDLSQGDRDKLNHVKCDTGIKIRNKRREWVNGTANEVETECKSKMCTEA